MLVPGATSCQSGVRERVRSTCAANHVDLDVDLGAVDHGQGTHKTCVATQLPVFATVTVDSVAVDGFDTW